MKYFEIKNIRKIGSGTLNALVDIQFGNLLIRGFKVIQNGEVPWVSVPQFSYKADGEYRFLNLLDLPHETMDEIRNAVLEAYYAA